MGHILSLFTYLLTTSVSGRVPGYPSYYPAGTRVINYPDTAALESSHFQFSHVEQTCMGPSGTTEVRAETAALWEGGAGWHWFGRDIISTKAPPPNVV